MDRPRVGEVVTPESVAMAFRTTYRPEAARGTTVGYEVRMATSPSAYRSPTGP